MKNKLEFLLEKIKVLEAEMLTELHEKEKEFGYSIQERKVHFQQNVAQKHRRLAKRLTQYFRDAKLSSYFTAPVILSCVVPVIIMDFWASVYQYICFPSYGIPKVIRRDYVIMDRQKLRYLNTMERWNCAYCGYVNGVIAYVQEIAGRTEQHWCPIKHALRLKTTHSRYQHFLDYGDAEQYRSRLEAVRREFEDVDKH